MTYRFQGVNGANGFRTPLEPLEGFGSSNKESQQMTNSLNHTSHRDGQVCEKSAPAEKNLDCHVVQRVRFLEGTVSWIEQDSTAKPDEYLEECNTRICGE